MLGEGGLVHSTLGHGIRVCLSCALLLVLGAAQQAPRQWSPEVNSVALTAAPDNRTEATEEDLQEGLEAGSVSWLGSLGPLPVSILVIFLSAGPAVAFALFKRSERRGQDEWGRRHSWKIDASDSG